MGDDSPGAKEEKKSEQQPYYHRNFLKPSSDNVVKRFPHLDPCCLDENINSNVSSEIVAREWNSFLKRSAMERKSEMEQLATMHFGLPPSWARSASSFEITAEKMKELKESGVNPSAVQTWRRKFIWFPGDSKRPPYYGSYSTNSMDVKPRRPLGQDPSIDYEVMSDIDWEEEPEGSSLSQGESLSDAGNESMDEEDSFFVADGHLSADEGVQSDEDEIVDKEVISLLVPENLPSSDDGSAAREAYANSLKTILDRSLKSGKPLVVTRTDINADANHGSCFQGDHILANAFEVEMLIPDAFFNVPEDPHADNEIPKKDTNVLSPIEAEKIGFHVSTIKGGQHADLLPALSLYIVENAAKPKAVLIDGFISDHKNTKITKKWVNESISLLAVRKGSKWIMKSKDKVTQQVQELSTPAFQRTPTQTISGPHTSEKVNTDRISIGVQDTADVQKNCITPGRSVDGPADPIWNHVVEELESDALEEGKCPTCESIFSPAHVSGYLNSLPASTLKVLIGVITRRDPTCRMHSILMSWLLSIVRGMDSAMQVDAAKPTEAGSLITRPRTASLHDVTNNIELIKCLCGVAKHAEYLAWQDCISILRTIIASKHCRATLKENRDVETLLKSLYISLKDSKCLDGAPITDLLSSLNHIYDNHTQR